MVPLLDVKPVYKAGMVLEAMCLINVVLIVDRNVAIPTHFASQE